jgi:peptide chain release factor 2
LKINSSSWTTVFEWDKKQKEIEEIEEKFQEEDLWKNSEKTAKMNQRLEHLKKETKKWGDLVVDFDNLKGYLNEIQENDSDLLDLIEKDFEKIEKKLENFEKKTFFVGKYDENDAILEIYAGAGGSDAQDWAEMLLRMYLRFIEKQGWKVNILNKSEGGEAGLKSVMIEVNGSMVFGNLKNEKGVHRLVRQSPFNSDALRQTSFAAVEIWPILEKSESEIEINPGDLRIDTFRSSGAGGQSVNTTDSAVRITHLPTSTVVTCQNNRSQMQNKEAAMKVLRAKLYEYFEEQQKKEQADMKGEYKSAEWGNQIRSYVFHPYKMVKDHRTGWEVSDVEKVMDGEIEGFIEACLRGLNKRDKLEITSKKV